jgi:hypothetical protein
MQDDAALALESIGETAIDIAADNFRAGSPPEAGRIGERVIPYIHLASLGS